MEDLKPVIAKNIVELRKLTNLTQAELASKLNYTDKAVSKWERAESVPDISVLKELAVLFGVTVDYLLESEHPRKAAGPSKQKRRNRLIIILLSVCFVVMVATLLFVGYNIFKTPFQHSWLLYVYAVPVASLVVLVLNSVWGHRRWVTNCVILSVLMWSLLLALYMSFLSRNLWLLFILGIPGQAMLLLWQNLKIRHK